MQWALPIEPGDEMSERRPFWTGFVELAPTRTLKVGDSVRFILSFMKDLGTKPTQATIELGPLQEEESKKTYFIVNDGHGMLKVYEEEIQ